MPEWAQFLIGTFGYVAVFVLVGVEGIGIPVPGETTLLVAAAVAGTGQLDIRIVILAAACGASLGEMGGYAIGRHWGRTVIDSYGHLVFLTPKRVALIERLFARFGLWVVLFGRYQALFRTYIGILAGVTRMPFLSFALVRTLSCIVWAVALGALAYSLGTKWETLQRYVRVESEAAIVAVLAIACVAIAVVLLRTRQRRHLDG